MANPIALFDRIDTRITRFMGRYGIPMLRISLGIIYVWFGALKFFPLLSPAEDLAGRTMEVLTFGLVRPPIAVYILAVWETLIGLGLIFGVFLRATLFLLFLQLPGTISPLFLFPQETFTIFPFVPNLEGQYILKNLVLLSAGIVVGSTVRRRRMESEPPKPSLLDSEMKT